MNVLLIYPKTNPYPHTESTPLSIFSLGSYLERKGVVVDYFDERVQPLRLLKKLIEKKPVLAGISSMTGYQIKRGIVLSEYVKKKDKNIPVCWGGAHPSMLPKQTLQNDYIDYIIKAEGEETLYMLYDALVNKKNSLNEIRGLCWKENGEIIENSDRPFSDVNKLPSPYESLKVKRLLKKYYVNKKNKGRFTCGYEVSRGCHNSCTYCYISSVYKNSMRIRKKELYKKDLLELKSLGVEGIFFYDNHISINDEFIKEFCEVLKDVGLEWPGGFRVNFIRDESTIKILEESNCKNLFFGIEAVEDEILKELKKGQNFKQIKNAVDLMSKSNIRATYSFLTGLPLESNVDMNKLFDFVDYIIKDNPKAEITIQPYTPFPGTILFRKAIERGFKAPEKLDDYWEFTTGDVIDPWVKNKEELLNIFLASFLRFRARYFLSRIVFFPLIKLAEIRWKKRFINKGFCA
jgi:radical SAM superfamily enzyme YgiQ (UPF0313 family)